MRVPTIAVMLTVLISSAGPALAISDQECDAKYAAARTTQSLNGMNRQAFGQMQCLDPSNRAPQPGSAGAPAPSASQDPTTPPDSKPKVVVPSKP